MNLLYDAELILLFSSVLRYSHSALLTHSRCEVLWGEREAKKKGADRGSIENDWTPY